MLTADNVKVIRPGDGLAPKFYEEIIGKKTKLKLAKGTPLKREFIE